MTASLTREDLLTLCERGFVPESAWRNRDSSAAQRQLGECYALLRAGCIFFIKEETDTLWVDVEFLGFDAFEWGDHARDHERFYVPTASRLARADGRDWY